MGVELTAEDRAAGRARIEAIAASFDPETLRRAEGHAHAQVASGQPWLIAGCSDGMGLHTAIAAIEAGILKVGLGVYWEPPHFLGTNEDGTRVSPVHWARVQNAAALPDWAADKGADLTVIAADVIMEQKRDLKGNAKGEPEPFSEEIREEFETVRAKSPGDDCVFVNSVAFGKWICPRQGKDPIHVPTIDFEGRIIEMKTKGFHARGYEETLDTMGRNHGLLLDAIKEFGWLGPDALTVFYTWAGGSQNVDVLEGIYGRGALGDAKVIAEADVAKFRIEHGLELGAHAIIRLPAFLSAALMGIPGGGLFGLISHEYLEARGLFEGMPRLSERMMDRMFGPSWIRENPIAQVELDTAETLYIEEISECVTAAHERIEAYWNKHPETRETAIPLSDSKQLLEGLAPAGYELLLKRFDPTYDGPGYVRTAAPEAPESTPRANAPAPKTLGDNEFEFQAPRSDMGGDDFRPDLLMVRALELLGDRLRDANELAIHAEHVEVNPDAWSAARELRCRVKWTNGGDGVRLSRQIHDQHGGEIARAQTTIGPRHDHPVGYADPLTLGEAVGPRMPIRFALHETYSNDASLATVLQGPALMEFARENLKVAGVFEDELPTVWDVRVDGTPQVGDHLLTYARRENDGWVVTVVDDESRPLLQMTLR